MKIINNFWTIYTTNNVSRFFFSIIHIHKFLFISRNSGKQIIDSSGVLFNRKGKVKKRLTRKESDKETRWSNRDKDEGQSGDKAEIG